jgi:hypothetical protein
MGPWQWRLPNPILDPMLKPPFGGKYRARKVILIDGQVGQLVDPNYPVPAEMLESHARALKDMAFNVLTEFALEQARKKQALEVEDARVV